jgi:hypothetical protein
VPQDQHYFLTRVLSKMYIEGSSSRTAYYSSSNRTFFLWFDTHYAYFVNADYAAESLVSASSNEDSTKDEI